MEDSKELRVVVTLYREQKTAWLILSTSNFLNSK